MAVGDALRRLCEEIGWSYAVFWKAIGAADPVHLVWEDGYCGHTSCPVGSEPSEALPTEVGCSAAAADTICSLVKKVMASQVHVVGEGTVGRAAFTGHHQWIAHGTANGHGLSSEVAAEMNNQFRVGIQTIAIIPVLPRGVLQLGSTGLVMENINFVMYAKKLCSHLNNRSSLAVSASVKNASSQHGQSRSLHGSFHAHSDDSSSKISSQCPVTSEPHSCPDTATVSISTPPNALLNASLLKVAQQKGQPVREHITCAEPDVRFIQQASYCESRFGSNPQSVALSSGLISPSLTSVKKQPLLMNSIGQLEFSNNAYSSADLARNIILKSLVLRDPSVCENTNINIHHGRYVVSNDINGPGNFDFLPVGARVNMANLYTGVSSQVLDQRCHSTSGTLLQKQPLVPSKAPESSEFSTKMENPEIGSFQVPSVPASESDGQVSNGLSTGRGNQLSRSNHIRQDQKINRVSDPSANVRTQIMKNGDECDLRGIPSERASSLLVEPTADNDLFDMLGAEFHQFSRNVGADLISWSGAESQNSDRDVPESSIYLDNSALFSSLDNELHHSGIFSLTDTDQLLDAVISNVNPGGKQCPDDSASCKTSLTDIPSTTHLAPKEFKPHESSGAPSVLIKHESAQFVKQPCFFDKSEDGCLSQNNGMHKSQIRLWIESGQNMKCESASASNSKGLDTPSKANRKRSRPGESLKPRPKDRQLIQDRIKELRELVPNSAKCSIDALLEKTVKHMLFLQSVTKNADKLKDSAESKILGGENGPLWKDYFEGGATWAFDVGSQSMTCPIIVEDLDRPRQMLVEMLCEDRGIFLEIADFIRGLGLTILRGVMEMHKSKIWAHFTVEANRDVTRMEIFLSLVRLLEPNCDGSGAAENANNVNMPLGLVHQPVIPATGRIQ
ncbi:transcription factor LHW-like isoform X1 [Phragmites australis]|uniref:transcription factor LHW-like isoform X1 n=1 Tax=Phragmites australis TaxID=29695 RepID=UPI002D7A0687|nr:transcription factor LHW-like isoform X1 [Phragmites australis]